MPTGESTVTSQSGTAPQHTWRRPSTTYLQQCGLPEAALAHLSDPLLLVLAWDEQAHTWLARTPEEGLGDALGRIEAEAGTGLNEADRAVLRRAGRWLTHTHARGLVQEVLQTGVRAPMAPDAQPWLRRLHALLEQVHAGLQPGKDVVGPARRPYGPRATPFTPGQGTVLSAPPVHGVTEAFWAIGSTHGGALHRQPNAPPLFRASNNVLISVGGNSVRTVSAEEEAALWQAALELDDDTAAAFWICMAKWFADTQGRDRSTSTRVHVADILSFRGLKQQVAGGYKTIQKQDVRQDILALNDVWVKSEDTVYDGEGKKRKPKTVYLESRLLEVAIESEDPEGQVPYAFRVRPGDWAQPYLTEDNRETALLLRPILQYDARQGVERMAMRIGLYLTLQWRTRASHATYGQSFKMETLLTRTRLGVPTDRRIYTRFRDQVEDALDRLQEDGLIGTRDEQGQVVSGWRYDKGDDATLPSSRWFPIWLRWTVLIPPPSAITGTYAHLAENRRTALKVRAPRRQQPSSRNSAAAQRDGS